MFACSSREFDEGDNIVCRMKKINEKRIFEKLIRKRVYYP
jgi:hypothetical protein